MRIYELAKQLEVANKDILNYLPVIGVQVKSHSSSINPEVVREVIRHFRPEPVAAPAALEEKKDLPKKKKFAKAAPSPEEAPGPEAAPEPGPAPAPAAEETPAAVIQLTEGLTVKELAERMKRPAAELQKALLGLGVMASLNQRLPLDAAELVAAEFGFKSVSEALAGETELSMTRDDARPLVPRPPIVTVMGHVDHGKTLLLDKIRKTDVVSGEAGGITQHIGAYSVTTPKGRLTFLDTPGHEAFTAMRARGASVTDIALLVVANDDGIMPQTQEAIRHAKAANVKIVVAINKCDLVGQNPDRILAQLSEQGLTPESWGGEVQVVQVSALTGAGVEALLERLLLEAELLELKAPAEGDARGTVIEASLDPRTGPSATFLVQTGRLSVGDALLVGATHGKARALADSEGGRVKEAGPSTPVRVMGLSDVPQVGDRFEVVSDEKTARRIAEERKRQHAAGKPIQSQRFTLEDLSRITSGEEKAVLPVVLRADALGSVEAIRDALERIQHDKVAVRILHASVGAVTDNDVNLAASTRAMILAFHVRPTPSAEKLAETSGVEIRSYKIIYELIQEIEKGLEGLLAPVTSTKTIGRVEVRKVFKITGSGTIAGSFVVDGMVRRGLPVRVTRDGVIVYEGKIGSLRRFKEDVREVTVGYECGVGVENFGDLKEGDVLEVLEVTETAQVL